MAMRNQIALAALTLLACTNDPVGPGERPRTGTVYVRVEVVPGGTPDLRGFSVGVGPHSLQTLPGGIELYFPQIPVGDYNAWVADLDPWCSDSGSDATYSVTAGDTVSLHYRITCDTLYATVRVITHTTVVDAPPPPYTVSAGATPALIGPSDTTLVHAPAWGAATVHLTGLAPWCTTTSASERVSFDLVDTLTVEFAITCGTAFRQADLVLDALGTGSTPALGLRVDSATHVVLHPGTPVRVTVRMDRTGVVVDSVSRGCVDLIPAGLTLAVGIGGAVPTDRVTIGCGRLSGLTERSTFSPMALLETGLDGRDTLILAEGLQHPYDGALSRDGEWYVGEQYRFEINPTRFEWRAYRERIDGSDFQLLHDWTTDRIIWPRWGPDDEHISYIERWSPGPQKVVIRARDGSTVDTLLLPPRHFVHAEWSPTGDRMALAAWCQFPDPACPTGIVIASPGNTTPIATYPVNFTSGQMAWSPDGTRIAFIGPESRVHVLRLADGRITKVAISTSQYQDESPEWDSSGELIGFSRIVPDQNQQPFHWLFVTAAEGGPERIIVQQRAYVGPYWQR